MPLYYRNNFFTKCNRTPLSRVLYMKAFIYGLKAPKEGGVIRMTPIVGDN